MKLAIGILLGIFFTTHSLAAAYSPHQIYTGSTLQAVSLDETLGKVQPGTIVIISELHDNVTHHHHQLEALLRISRTAHQGISLGMEFFEYTKQNYVDEYLTGILDEASFLKNVSWGGNNWGQYKPLVEFPKQAGGTTWALNAPRKITGKVAKHGIGNLTPEEQALLPPNWSMGNDLYLKRFKEVMGGHVPEDALMRYFTSQSLWDETMAWRAVSFMEQNPEQILVIVVGDFHAQYGGGLPEKIHQRGWHRTLTISQVDLKGLSLDEEAQVMRPHPDYGPRADLIWVGGR